MAPTSYATFPVAPGTSETIFAACASAAAVSPPSGMAGIGLNVAQDVDKACLGTCGA